MVQVPERGGSHTETSEGTASLLPTLEVAELKEQFKNDKLQLEFYKACYNQTGYWFDMRSENQYQLTLLYTECREDCLIFKAIKTLQLQDAAAGNRIFPDCPQDD